MDDGDNKPDLTKMNIEKASKKRCVKEQAYGRAVILLSYREYYRLNNHRFLYTTVILLEEIAFRRHQRLHAR